jgi:hypothetical protein
MRAILVAVLCASVWGCATRSPQPQRFAGSDKYAHMPERTPFDADPAMRAVYLNYYWFGFREGRRGASSSYCDNGHPWYEVQMRGYYDGQTAGLDTWSAVSNRYNDTGHATD